MKSKLLHEAAGKRTFAVILQTDDEAMRCLKEFAEKEGIGGAEYARRNRAWLMVVICWLAVPLTLAFVFRAAIQRTGSIADPTRSGASSEPRPSRSPSKR